MKKSILSLLLAVVLTFGATQGMVSAFASVEANKDTPVAQIANDDYVPYDYAKKSVSNNTEEEPIYALTNQLKSLGGHLETYGSEEEYLNAQNETINAVSYEDEYSKEVKQVITVMTTATGSEKNGNYVESKPIANAIVRLNGVPRYTDRNGQISVHLIKGNYYELFIEKDGYNPYIEVIDITGENKTVHLKQPSDDIDVYAVMFYYYGMTFNLISQNCYYNKDYFRKYCDLTILSNLQAEEYYILVNGERKFYSSTGAFFNLNLDKYSRDDKFSVQVIYNGVASKVVEILLTVVDAFIDLSFDMGDASLSQGVNDDALGDLGTVDLDFNAILEKTILSYINKDVIGIHDPLDENFSLKLGYYYDPSIGEVQYSVGITITFDIGKIVAKQLEEQQNKAKELEAENEKTRQQISELEDQIAAKEQEKAELQKKYDRSEINKENYLERKDALLKEKEDLKSQLEKDKSNPAYVKNEQDISKIHKNVNDNLRYYDKRQKDLNDKIANAAQEVNNNEQSISDLLKAIQKIPEISKAKQDFANFFNKNKNCSLKLSIDVLGTVYYSCVNEAFTKVSIAMGATLKFSYTYPFAIWVIPCFVKVELSGGFKLQATFDLGKPLTFEQFISKIEFILVFGLRVDVGVGGSLASVSVFGSVEIEMGLNFWCMFNNRQCFKVYLNWQIGVRLNFFVWEREYSHYETEKFLDYDLPQFKLMSRSNALSCRSLSENQFALNVFQNSHLKLIKLNDDKEMILWLEDTLGKDDYNRTTLKYALIADGNKVIDSSINDDANPCFAFDVIQNDDGVFVLSQKATRQITENDTPQSILESSQLEVAHINVDSGKVEWVKHIPYSSNCINQQLSVSDNNNLTVTWIENTNSDVFGLSGNNYVKYSEYKNGEWTTPQIIFTSDTAIYDLSSAYVDNNVVVALTVDEDDDFYTTNTNLIVVRNGVSNQISNGEYLKSQFCYVDGKLTLYYTNNGYLYGTQGNFQNSEIETTLDANDFYIQQSNGNLIITYEKYVDDYKQVMCSYKMNGIWTNNVQLTDEQFSCSESCGYFDNDKISFVYKISDEQGLVALCYDVVEFTASIKVENITFDGYLQNGIEKELTIKISNIGNVDINSISVNCFGQVIRLKLDEPLKVSEFGYFDLVVIPRLTDETMIIISVEGYGYLGGTAIDEYLLDIDFVDLSLDISSSILSNGSQNIKLRLVNDSNVETDYSINVYINGEFHTVIAVGNIGGNEEWEKDYVFDNVNLNDYITFEAVATKKDKYKFNNHSGLYIVSAAESSTTYNNNYSDALIVAKGLLM